MINKAKRRSLAYLGGIVLMSLGLAVGASCQKEGSVKNLFNFSDTKDVKVQVGINFKIDTESGPVLDFSSSKFILNAYALDADGAQVAIAQEGGTPVDNLPVTLTGPSLDFNAVLRIPVGVQPRADGYALRFELRDESVLGLTQNSDSAPLSALRGDVKAGTAPDTNRVDLSIVSGVAAQIVRSSITDPGSIAGLSTYGEIIELLKSRTESIEQNTNSSQSPGALDFAKAIQAALMNQVVSDTDLQSTLSDKIIEINVTNASGEAKVAAQKRLAEGFSSTLTAFVATISSNLSDSSAATSKVFVANYIDVTALPDPDTYTGTIHAPLALEFSDVDMTIAIGGDVLITAPLSTDGVTSFNIYFGKAARSGSKLSLIGNVGINGTGSVSAYTMGNGTMVPADAIRLWAYPVKGSTEIDSPTWVALVNDKSSVSEEEASEGTTPTTPSTPTTPTTPTVPVAAAPSIGSSIISFDLVNLGWNRAVVQWGAATDSVTSAGQLQYKLVRASSSAAIDTLTEANSVGGSDLLMNWAANTLTFEATNLNAAETYFFAVLVRNNAGEIAHYPPQSVTTLVSDTTAPVVGGGGTLTESNVTTSGLTLSWTAASDAVSSQANLQYKLVKSLDSTEIDSLLKIPLLPNSAIVQDWTTNISTKVITGLTDNTLYSFALVVRDTSLNQVLYTVKDVTTLEIDVTPPVAGASGAMTFASVAARSLTVNWTVASDNITATNLLQYRLVKAPNAADIDTAAEIEAVSGSDLLMDWTANIATRPVTGLTPEVVYHFAVIVRDLVGNKTLYVGNSQLTPVEVFYIFGAGGAAPLSGGISGLDAHCNNNGTSPDASLTYKALVPKAGERVACTTANCVGATGTSQNLGWVLKPNVQYSYKEYPNGTPNIIGTTNAHAIFEFPTSTSLHSVVGVRTGFNDDWTTGANCSGWTNATAGANGAVGTGSTSSSSALNNGATVNCGSGTRVLCVSQ